MEKIPQRELRNRVSAVLRAAEAGERYTITVDGRPVAELGPLRPRQWVRADDVRALLATQTDTDVLEEVAAQAIDAGLDHDPWGEG
jgi:prevent-host-death family protein